MRPCSHCRTPIANDQNYCDECASFESNSHVEEAGKSEDLSTNHDDTREIDADLVLLTVFIGLCVLVGFLVGLMLDGWRGAGIGALIAFGFLLSFRAF
jgi:hypothetical protein